MKKIYYVLSIALCMILLCGVIYGITHPPDPTGNEKEASAADAATLAYHTVVDMTGVEVQVPNEIERVVCIQPTLTEYIIAFGAGDKLVGTHKNTLNKPWLQKLYPRLSELKAYSYSASAEDVLASGADVVIVPSAETADTLRQAGIPTVVITLEADGDEFEHARILSEIFGREVQDQFKVWRTSLWLMRRRIDDALEEHGITEGPSVYLINGQSDKGLYYPQGGGGSVSEVWLHYVRASMALHDYTSVTGMPTEEEILAADPEVIMIGGAYGVPLRESLMNDPAWADIRAVQNGRIYTVPIGGIGWDQGFVAAPLLIKYYANTIYPDIFDYDLTTDAIAFYEDYFGVTLNAEDISDMCAGLTPEGKPAWAG